MQMTPSIDSLWIHCRLATMAGPEPYGLVPDAALAVSEGVITWLGPFEELPPDYLGSARDVHQLKGALVTPGFIDCHTHVVYAGNRAGEFAMRLQGATYQEIAGAGGGIASTVRATRSSDEQELFRQSAARVRAMLAQGVATLEIKSGYGLDTESELKTLRVAKRLGSELGIEVHPTFLGAHALPPEYAGQPEAYLDLLIDQMLPAVAEQKIATAVDAYCEGIGFSPSQVERLFEAAGRYGFKLKLHAEQFSNLGGVALAARWGALSADHLEHLDEAGVEALSGSGTTAVLLPGAYYFLGETQKPPIELLRKAGVPMAVSTDCNPGTSPCLSLPLMMNMACVLLGLTPAEALAGVTVNAARALGLAGEVGTLEAGKRADLAVWDVEHPDELSYDFGTNHCQMVVKNGRLIYAR